MIGAARAVCLCTPEYPPRPGGVSEAAARLAGMLRQGGYAVHVLTPERRAGAAGTLATVAGDDSVRVHRFEHDDPDGPAGQFAFRRALQQIDAVERFALLHGFYLTAAYPCIVYASRIGRTLPVIASIRGSDVATLLDLPPARAVLLPVLRKATWITSVNAAYLARVAEEVDVDGRASVVHNSAPVPDAHEEPWSLSAANRGIVGTVGEFRKVKDVPLFVRAFAAVPGGRATGLLLAGFFSDDEEQDWTDTLIAEFGLGGRVELTGAFARGGSVAHLRRMHVYVQSSAFEGLPNALLEAAALGVPIVATAVGGMREVIVDGESGLLVPHGDPQALAAAITRVLSDDALAACLSAGARGLAAALSPDRERQEWLTLYARLLGADAPAPSRR